MKLTNKILKETIDKTVKKVLKEKKEQQIDIIVENVLKEQLSILSEEKKTKNNNKGENKKRAVIQWLNRPEIDKAEIRRKLEGEPESQEEEDSKRSYFMKKVNQSYGKNFTDEEINKLYSIKTSLGQ
jgi:hypothetical protein